MAAGRKRGERYMQRALHDCRRERVRGVATHNIDTRPEEEEHETPLQLPLQNEDPPRDIQPFGFAC